MATGWCWARGADLGSLAGRVALVQTPDGHDGFADPVKRIVQNAERWWLRSDNPERPSLEVSAETTPIAQLVATIRPEPLGPAIGERLAPDEIGAAFGLASATTLERTARYEGHLFVVITDEGHFSEPDRLQTIITDRRPGETAFVLARPAAGAPLRYCGVARWLEPDGPWSVPALDFQTWRALGRGRECSRRLLAAAIECGHHVPRCAPAARTAGNLAGARRKALPHSRTHAGWRSHRSWRRRLRPTPGGRHRPGLGDAGRAGRHRRRWATR
jgi:hypothetical protein